MDEFKKTGGIAAFFNRVPPKKEVKDEENANVKHEMTAIVKSDPEPMKMDTDMKSEVSVLAKLHPRFLAIRRRTAFLCLF